MFIKVHVQSQPYSPNHTCDDLEQQLDGNRGAYAVVKLTCVCRTEHDWEASRVTPWVTRGHVGVTLRATQLLASLNSDSSSFSIESFSTPVYAVAAASCPPTFRKHLDTGVFHPGGWSQ